MLLLFSSCRVFTTPSPYSSTMPMAMAITTASPTPISRLQMIPIALHQLSFNRNSFITNKRGALSVKASAEAWGLDGGESHSESDDEEDLPFDQLPLDSKLQLKLEKKMRMKLSKKVRLRRKKLVHKRRMRKRGRWPPSKMKKLKNV